MSILQDNKNRQISITFPLRPSLTLDQGFCLFSNKTANICGKNFPSLQPSVRSIAES